MGCLTITFSAASVLRRCTSYTTFSSVCLSGQSNIHITGLDKGRARPRLCLLLQLPPKQRLVYLFYQPTSKHTVPVWYMSRTGALQPVNECCQFTGILGNSFTMTLLSFVKAVRPVARLGRLDMSVYNSFFVVFFEISWCLNEILAGSPLALLF